MRAPAGTTIRRKDKARERPETTHSGAARANQSLHPRLIDEHVHVQIARTARLFGAVGKRDRPTECVECSLCQPSATMRSIGTRANSAISGGTRTSYFMSRSESRSFSSVIIFMYTQLASGLAGMNFTSGAAISSG